MNNVHCFSNLYLTLTLISISCFTHTCHGVCNPVDRDSLSSLNLSLSSSPRLDWSLSVDCCDWEGITCDGGTGNRVTSLWLPSRGLFGTISPSILNLTSLTQLTLSHNSLSGPLPARFFQSLNQLQIIDLSLNHLTGELNSSDTLPATARIFNFSSNNFYGPIQTPFIETGLNLETFDVNNNSFSGTIPSFICSFSPSIKRLDFSINDFTGPMPQGFGQCKDLLSLRAGFNNLSGSVPGDIYGLVPLEELYLPGNRLTGPIDPSLLNLTNLKSLALFGNQLTGPIPEKIGNLYKLEQLQLHINKFNGTVPGSLSNCTNLTLLNLRVNHLGGELSSLNFSRFVRLKTVDFGNNFFTGNLPRALFLCKTLTAVRFSANKLSGEVVPEIASLPLLSFLTLSNNTLTNVTSAIRILSGCQKLRTLTLSMNFYGEALSDDDQGLVGFQNLQLFGMSLCNLTGRIPMWVSDLNMIELLDLSGNSLTGFVPSWLAGLPNLYYLDLGYNLLTGGFPMELLKIRLLSSDPSFGLIKNIDLELPVLLSPDNISNFRYNQVSYFPRALQLAKNRLDGLIPPEIGQLKYVMWLDLSSNNFSGEIPNSISNLTKLERLDLSTNSLTGEIPVSLQNLNFLSYFNVSNNGLEGPIPTGGQFGTFLNSSFEGNPRLCGRVLQRSCNDHMHRSETGNGRKYPRKTIILSLVISSAISAMVLLLYLFFSRRAKIITPRRREINEKDLEAVSFNSSGVFSEKTEEPSLVVMFPKNESSKFKDLTIADMLKATDNFNQANVIGLGGFGLVYKATLPDGSIVAIKKLPGDTGLIEREFKAEVEALSTAQHKNIVTLLGYCLHGAYRLLIYSHMASGSVDYWLHRRPEELPSLDWKARLKIARGASDGVAYMHETCEPHIVHRDLRSSTVLLDHDFEARVADFGLARLIMNYDTHVSTELVGTLGYVPPEYNQSWVATLRGDIYSFGVVVLELLTGKRPVVEDLVMSRDLVEWVREMKKEGREDEIFDPVLRGNGFEDEMTLVLDVACMCVSQNPVDRPSIKQVVDCLNNVGN